MNLNPAFEVANAFFGAFFGFWLSSYIGIVDKQIGALPEGALITSLLLSLSLNIIGLSAMARLDANSPIKTVFQRGWPSLLGLVFFVAPVAIIACTVSSSVFWSAVGILIYIWWLAVLFVASFFKD